MCDCSEINCSPVKFCAGVIVKRRRPVFMVVLYNKLSGLLCHV